MREETNAAQSEEPDEKLRITHLSVDLSESQHMQKLQVVVNALQDAQILNERILRRQVVQFLVTSQVNSLFFQGVQSIIAGLAATFVVRFSHSSPV